MKLTKQETTTLLTILKSTRNLGGLATVAEKLEQNLDEYTINQINDFTDNTKEKLDAQKIRNFITNVTPNLEQHLLDREFQLLDNTNIYFKRFKPISQAQSPGSLAQTIADFAFLITKDGSEITLYTYHPLNSSPHVLKLNKTINNEQDLDDLLNLFKG